MRIFLIVMMMLLPTLAAQAIPEQKRDRRQEAKDEVAKERRSIEEEKAYKATIKRIPVQKPVDPWGKVR
jgi:hypothetical protein